MSATALRTTPARAFPWLRIAAAFAAIGSVATLGYVWLNNSETLGATKVKEATSPPPLELVSAIGRLEPKSRVIRLAPPMAMEPARVETLSVAEGDWVEEGNIVAVLDTRERRLAAVEEAEARVAIAKSVVEQVKAGAKAGDIAAQQAMVQRNEATLKNAEAEWQRIESLARSGSVTKSDVDRVRTDMETAAQTLAQCRAALVAIKEVRSVDVVRAEAELQAAKAAVAKATADARATSVHAPFAGRVLEIHAKRGEKVGDKGILELADTARMQAVAEVYEADIAKVRLGQTAEVRVPSMNEKLTATVEQIGFQVGRKSVFDNDPVADTDARVVEVRLQLSPTDALKVERYTNLRVEVRIRVAE